MTFQKSSMVLFLAIILGAIFVFIAAEMVIQTVAYAEFVSGKALGKEVYDVVRLTEEDGTVLVVTLYEDGTGFWRNDYAE